MKALILLTGVVLKGDMEMFNANDYINEYENLPDGFEKIRVLKNAFKAAEEAGNYEWEFIFRNECIHQSVLYGDTLDALLTFPQMAALFDSHEEIQDEHLDDLMWSYKYIIENIFHFYNISLSQADALFEDFLKRIRKYGYSERTYQYFTEKRSIYTKNYLSSDKYGLFLDMKRDDLSDCDACEHSFAVMEALAFDDEKKAAELFEPIEKGKLKCAEVPQETYALWIDYYIEKGRYSEALAYARRLSPMVKGEIDLLNATGILLLLYSQTDSMTGVSIFRKELPNFIHSRDHWARLSFAYGALRLFRKYTESDGEQFRKIFMRLSPEFELFSSDNIYSTEELYNYFYKIASDLSEKFDKRNGNSYFTDRMASELPEYEEGQSGISGCYSEYIPSAVAAVCRGGSKILSTDEMISRINTVFSVDEYSEDERSGALKLIISDGEEQYHAVLVYEQMTDPSDFRPVHYIDTSVFEGAEKILLSMVLFNERPDVSFQFQIKLLMTLYPDSAALLDFSRHSAFSADWARIQAESSVPPLVSYLFSLSLVSTPDTEKVWITTVGMNCCGLREIEIFDADKENYQNICDIICFAAEGAILRNGLNSPGEYCFDVRSESGKNYGMTWLPVANAVKVYQESGLDSSYDLRYDDIGENSLVLMCCGDGTDDHESVRPLTSLGNDEIMKLRAGMYIDSDEKTTVYAGERIGIFRKLTDMFPEQSYACISFNETNGKEDFVWIKVMGTSDDKISGILTEDCGLGKQGDQTDAENSRIINFHVNAGEISVDPDTAYLIESI